MTSEVWAALFGLAGSLVAGMFLIPSLRRLKIGQSIRSDGPQSHQTKAGTPTIGGLIFIIAAPVATIAYYLANGLPVNMPAILLMAFPALYAVVGFIDDYRKVRKGRSLGLRAREKMALQILFLRPCLWSLCPTQAEVPRSSSVHGTRLTLECLTGSSASWSSSAPETG